MRFRSSRRKGSYFWAVVGGCLLVYVVLAVAFNWLIAPIVATYEPNNPPAVTTVLHSNAPVVAPDVRSQPPPPVRSSESARDHRESEPALSPSAPPSEQQAVTTPAATNLQNEHRSRRPAGQRVSRPTIVLEPRLVLASSSQLWRTS
jgi:hypothetical protein